MGTGQPVGARGHRRRDDHMRRPAYRCKSMRARGCRRGRRCVGGASVWDLSPLPVRLSTTRAHSFRCMRECADRAADAPLTLFCREHAGTRSPAALRSPALALAPPPLPIPPLPPPHPTSHTQANLAVDVRGKPAIGEMGGVEALLQVPPHGNGGGRGRAKLRPLYRYSTAGRTI